jgi:hypothetical protein
LLASKDLRLMPESDAARERRTHHVTKNGHAMTSSPTCVVAFADGETTRMTVCSASGKPDLRRGIKLAHAAYESGTMSKPPAITALHFETVGGESVKFTADQIAEVTDDAR